MAHLFLHDIAASVSRIWREAYQRHPGEGGREFDARVAEFGRARAIQPSRLVVGVLPEQRIPEEPATFAEQRRTAL